MRAKTKPKRELDWPSCDAVTKDLIQRDRPTLLTELTGGRAIKQTLNVEFAVVKQRRADLLFELDDASCSYWIARARTTIRWSTGSASTI